jgi:[glutamine synthetase] adenylyltransferase / [glutamine synthetase]-adenylyl-L-tyrosine phosphorylase
MKPNSFLKQLPRDLQDFAKNRLDAWERVFADEGISSSVKEKFLCQLLKVSLASDYFFEQFLQQSKALSLFLQDDHLKRSYKKDEQANLLSQQLKKVNDQNELNQSLRKFRRNEMLRIIWRDILGLADLQEIIGDLSTLADVCINQAVQKLQLWQLKKMGVEKNFREQQLQVLAMGKLGGSELNLSSDVDLLFAFSEEGEIEGAARHVESQQFFIQLGQALIQTLNAMTADGFVFRVDMRLRPYGESGPLAMSFAALEDYYQEQGRDWERYALVKARMICGDAIEARNLFNMLHTFVYRRYIDFTAMQSLRDMKELIRQQVKEKGLEDNIKLGAGGIREIEFIVQTFQLIHGGQDHRLREPQLLKALRSLSRCGYLDKKSAERLREAYIFLRNLENRLQAIADKQVHQLPQDNLTRARIAYAMNFDSWKSLVEQLNLQRQFIAEQFEKVIAKPKKIPSPVFEKSEEDCSGSNQTVNSNLQNIVAIWEERFQGQGLSDLARRRLNRVLPRVFYEVTICDKPTEALDRVMKVIESLIKHSAYLVLLEENPKALMQLIKLCDTSQWVCEQIANYPLLLGELLDAKRLYLPINYQQLKEQLSDQLSAVDVDELEHILNVLRRFKRRHELRVAAADVSGVLPVMKVSDYLTDIAVVILQQVLKIAWRELIAKYGYPLQKNGKRCTTNFAIVAYGKLGGIELGYGSDLDLVFLHDGDEEAMTNGQDAITGAQFFSRLTQRILHLLSMQTDTGRLYEVDTRLKPSGQAGMIVSSFSAFADYQKDSAWLWEHQALVRARVVAGDKELKYKFDDLRCEILRQPHDKKELQEKIGEMRERMRKEAKKPPRGKFDLKQGRGGITDIEFITQYVVLAWAQKQPELLMFPDNIRILETCESAGLLSRKTIDLLCDAYRAYRDQMHHLRLQYQPNYVASKMFAVFRRGVRQIWRELLVLN